MTLSGTFKNVFRTGYGIEMDWSAVQSVPNNTSTITVKLYWCSYGSAYTISSSATKTGTITTEGQVYSFSTSGASLTGNARKLIATSVKTVSHDTNGNLTADFNGTYNCAVTLGGTYYGSVSVTGSATLNNIPRKSTLASSSNFTAGNDLTVTITRASSSFTHTVTLSVQNTSNTWVTITTKTGVATSVLLDFTTAENTAIFNALNGSSSRPSKIKIETFSGATSLGYNEYTGTCTSPVASTTASSVNWNIGNSVPITITRANSLFTHTVRFKVGTTVIHTETGIGTTVTWTPTADEITTQYNLTPNSKTIASTVEIDTFFNGEIVRTTTSKTGTATVVGSQPIFGTGYIYSDTNAKTVSITNNNTMIVQNKSIVEVTIPFTQKATPQNGASILNYVVTLGNQTAVLDYSDTVDLTVTLGTINTGADQLLTVKAVDSRGNSTSTSMNVTMIPYDIPSINATAVRLNGFETTTVLTMNGQFSLISINGTPKNDILSVQYRYKDTKVETATTWDSWSDFTFDINADTYTANPNVALELDNTSSWNIEWKIEDLLGNVVFAKTVSTGIPIAFIDSKLKSLGIGMFPDKPNYLQVSSGLEIGGDFSLKNGMLVFNDNGTADKDHIWFDDTNNKFHFVSDGADRITGNASLVAKRLELAGSVIFSNGGGIDLKNSDIIGMNCIYFNDTSTTTSEGINFIKTGATVGSVTLTDYDNFRVLDGTAYLNGIPIGSTTNNILWTGGYYLTDTQTITPSKPLQSCVNGWCLIWSDYNATAPASPTDADFVHTFISKQNAQYNSWHNALIGNYATATTIDTVIKQFQFTNTTIVGHAMNNSADLGNNNNDVVLRWVVEF